MKIDQRPFPTNTVEVSSKDKSWVKLLTSDLAQNKGAVDPKVQVTTVDVKGKGYYLKKETWSHIDLLRPRCWSTSSSVNKRKQGEENSGHGVPKDIGDVCSSSNARKKGSSYQR
jgi:hypothetical protein